MWRRWLLSLLAIVCVTTSGLAQTRTIVRQPWYESAIDSDAITIEWSTNEPAAATLAFGVSSDYERGTFSGGSGTSHGVTLTHLTSATIYAVRIIANGSMGADTVQFYTSTSSPKESSESIDAYFNHAVDQYPFPLSKHGHDSADLLGVLRPLIDSAQRTIDLAVYSFSGKTGNIVHGWLRDARVRGVRVRLIADSGSIRNSTAYRGLAADSIRSITNGFGATGDSWSNIHHNKFVIVDASDPARAAVLTGSWNLSDQQTTTDYQNVVIVRDQALAKAYKREFDEEWGSSGSVPDSANSRFSYRKTDNTPRSFRFGSRELHLLFSPNGGVSDALDYEIGQARSNVLFAMYQFTKASLANALIAARARGVDVHGIIGAGGASDEYDALKAAGLDVVHYAGYQTLDTLLHHKFAIFDNRTVATGSFNWTQSAEDRNNENELLFIDPELARDYFLEWRTRYRENGGTQDVRVPATVSTRRGQGTIAIFPNPSHDIVTVRWNMLNVGSARIALTDELGTARFEQSGTWSHGICESMLDAHVAPGVYQVTIVHDGVTDAARVVILH